MNNQTELQLHTAVLRQEVKKRSDKLMNYFLISYFIGGLLLARYYDTWLVAFGIGSLSLAIYYSAKILLPHSNLYQYVLAGVLGIFMAQYIYQMHGMFEMHFVAFIGSAILITYQNWKLQIPLAAIVVLHHASFGYMQNLGFTDIYFTQLDALELQTFIIHVILAAVIFLICGLWAYQLRKSSEIQIGQSMEMGRLQKQAHVAAEEQRRQKELLKAQQELKELNDALEKEKYFLDSLMDSMTDAIYFKDEQSRIMRVSKYMADRFGLETKDLIGKTDFDFQDEVHAKEAFDDEQNIQKTGNPKIDYIEKEIRSDGTELWVSTTKMPLKNGRGEIVGTFGISRDITNVKNLEREQRAALLDKAVAQGRFEIASDVMHDIGNAVVGFGSYLTRIRRMQEEDQSANLENLFEFFNQQNEALTAALGETKATAVIKMLKGMVTAKKNAAEDINKSITEQFNIIAHIQEILNIQRQYVTGHESQERKPVNLRHIVNDAVSMLFGSIDKTGIVVSLDIPADIPPIKGDRTKLMQVIINLLKNSIEAIDKNSSEKKISITAHAYSGSLIIQIKDSGHGFDWSVSSQLFRRGFTTKSSASGLGLYNCLSIIESHEGSIEINSEGAGKGSLTTISFRTGSLQLTRVA